MKNYFLQQRSALLIGVIIIAFALLAPSFTAHAADKPALPILSLTGSDGKWNTNFYPDGRIWLPASESSKHPREILVPVFVENRWAKYNTEAGKIYNPEPIISFRFSVQYDSSALRAIGYSLEHPVVNEETFDIRYMDGNGYYKPLANKFDISWYDEVDESYKLYLRPNLPLSERRRGRCITIVGTSTKPLPNTDLNNAGEFKVLLYLKFRVIPSKENPATQGGNQPLIIKTDTIMWNKLNVCQDAPFKEMRPYNSRVEDDYPDINETNMDGPLRSKFAGVAGIDNRVLQFSKWVTEPCLPGVIYMQIRQNQPRFGFEVIEQGRSQQPPIDSVNSELWIVKDPLTSDSAWAEFSANQDIGTIKMQILNTVSISRMTNITVESDQPWLVFRSIRSGPNDKFFNTMARYTHKGVMNYIDKDIIGNLAINDPLESMDDKKDGDVKLQIKADENLLDAGSANDPEKTGVYVGYLTFTSDVAEISPIRVRITWIRFRNPSDDIKNGRFYKTPGIEVVVKNSRGFFGDSTNLIFGTGDRASAYVDSLFGEHPEIEQWYGNDGSLFGARWYPITNEGKVLDGPVVDKEGRFLYDLTYGLGDFAPFDEDPHSESRDIRSNRDTNNSIVYLCRFNAGGAANYPIKIEWDTQDFPDNAQLYLRDTLNGSLFPSVNMRQATSIGGTRQAYWIGDPNITSFKIEYTLPSTVEYVEVDGTPKIKRGWNLLSMPVRPTNNFWKNVYPNGINKPWRYSMRGYQDEEYLKPGVGYFIRYSDKVDTRFAGTPLRRITIEQYDELLLPKEDLYSDTVRVYPDKDRADGADWNTIGGLTRPVSIERIEFSPFDLELPDKNFTLRKGVWGYKTGKGYYETYQLEPGFGYWIKTDASGYVSLVDPMAARISMPTRNIEKEQLLARNTKLTISDNLQNSADLYIAKDAIDKADYELPPLPPTELFDVRFSDNVYVENGSNVVINMQSVEYPISINLSNSSANYTFIDPVDGTIFGSIAKGSSSNIEISKTKADKVQILKSDVVMSENGISSYPNPVNSVSTISFTIPSEEHVTIKLYDALGNEVSTILTGNMTAGNHEVRFDAANLSSGRYIARLTAGAYRSVTSITIVK